MPKLVVQSEDSRKEYELGAEAVVLGRSSTCPVVVPDDQASREHCRVEPEGGKWFVTDLASSNGTFVDGRRITRDELANGAVIRIGKVRVSFVDEAVVPEPEILPKPPAGLALRMTGGPRDGETFALGSAVTRIGRNAQNEIALNDPAVSNFHAELIVKNDVARIVDKASRNGVKVNGALVNERDLDPGDQIAIGATTFEFVAPGVETAKPSDEGESHPADAIVARPTIFTRRVKILAAVVAVILVVGLLLNTTSGPSRKVYPDNLLMENPSFEERGAGGIPGWAPYKGSASLDGANVEDGALALRLVSAAGAGPDLSALCWSAKTPVSPAHQYELSALVKNSGGESAALCVAWLSSANPWLRSLEMGARTDDALAWRRVSETFTPPSWADGALFGCALVGQGQAKFDGFCLRDAGAAPAPRRVAAGRIEIESGQRGEFVVLADGRPFLGRGHAAVTSAGQVASQSAAVLKSGYPRAEPNMVQVVGKLGFAGKLPFEAALSSNGSEITLHYDIDTSTAPDAVAAIEMLSSAELPGPDKLVALETTRGTQTSETAPFDNRSGVTLITFLSGGSRVFVTPSSPVTVSAVRTSGQPGTTWRIELPIQAGHGALSLTWLATTPEHAALIAAELKRIADAEDQLGKAVAAYGAFIAKYRLYADERVQAEQRLRSVESEIAASLKAVNGLIARARMAKEETDFLAAEHACDTLIKKLGDHEGAKTLAAELAKVKTEHQAAVQQKKEQEANNFLANAKRHIESKEFNIARTECDYVIKQFPGTPFADEARKLLDTIPKPD